MNIKDILQPDYSKPTQTNSVLTPEVKSTFDQRTGLYFVISVVVPDTSAATAANYGVFYTAPFACELIEAWETHKVASSSSSLATLGIEKLTGGQALDAGVVMTSSLFDIRTLANDPNRISCTSSLPTYRFLNPGDRMALKDFGVLTALSHVEVSVLLKALNYDLSTVNNPA